MAEAILAMLAPQKPDDDLQRERAFVGAMLLAEGLVELRRIRQALTKG